METRSPVHTDYSHRDVLDKLGIKPGHAIACGSDRGYLDESFRARMLDKAGRDLADESESCDIVLIDIGGDSDPIAELARWRPRLTPAGGIWLLTRKRGQPDYVDQRELIDAGPAAGLVDNKICSVSLTISAMRFVIRRIDRGR